MFMIASILVKTWWQLWYDFTGHRNQIVALSFIIQFLFMTLYTNCIICCEVINMVFETDGSILNKPILYKIFYIESTC